MSKATIKKRNKKLIEVLGPVDNLESYVKADWWRHLFNANYLRTDGDVVGDNDITKNEVDIFLEALKASKDDRILDLCCGQGRHTLEIAQRGYTNVTGLDRSHYLIDKARRTTKTLDINAAFKEGDARKLPFHNDTFDAVIIAGNSFGYFESVQDDMKVLTEVMRVLKPSGKLLIDITDCKFIRENFQPRSWEWIDKNYFVCRERSLSENKKRLVSREVITHVVNGVVADQFYAERLYSNDDLKNLLQKAGFTKYRNYKNVTSESKRNQDLGMMAQRIIVTAVAQKEWSPTRKLAKTKDTVIVLMGDPQKTDLVKPDANFDEDDFYTINELRKALAELDDFNFIYLNQHDTMLKDLLKYKDKCNYVFNLCDEGFNNEPTKELHVTALLEVLGYQYSGGTPQCLAYCYDKSLIRGIAKEMDIPVPNAFMIKPEDIQFVEFPLTFPIIVKPNFGDSSFGITQRSVCYDLQTLENAIVNIRKRFGYNNPILVEEFLTGKDISVGIIGNPTTSYTILPIIEEDYSALPEDLPRICGYEAKWDPDSPYWKIKSVPAKLSEDVERFLGASCLKLFERLECRDYARFDWRLDENGTPRLLEVNPNPGWCWDGHLAKMAKIQSLSYSDMLNCILEACKNRIMLAADPQKKTSETQTE
ncbi:MAG: methyltransferase domain-containing protein [Sedimentisphaerales bacterium]|nr:methyltransferase domain-containing protein [Sedimentisphaerales bacterium]